ncbi:MAG: hypothetical protein ACE5H3_04450 [Planctomycetota bacterium]
MKKILLGLMVVGTVAAVSAISSGSAFDPETFRVACLADIPHDVAFAPDVIASFPEPVAAAFQQRQQRHGPVRPVSGTRLAGKLQNLAFPSWRVANPVVEVQLEMIRTMKKTFFLAYNYDIEKFPGEAADVPPNLRHPTVPTTASVTVNGTTWPMVWNGSFFSLEIDSASAPGRNDAISMAAFDGNKLLISGDVAGLSFH